MPRPVQQLPFRFLQYNKMNKQVNRWIPIAIFYVIAVAIRAISLKMGRSDVADITYFLKAWAQGAGPCIGALVVVLLFRRKFCCSITGTSVIKSLLSVAVPFIVVFFLHQKLSFVMLGFIFYSFLEEVGWRGYLQGELSDMKPFTRAILIGTLWFLWHVHISFSWGGLIFLAILIFGAWGIGHIADDTRSLVACACFHTLYNFSTHGFFEFSPAVICLYVGIIASWFVIWYVPWDKWARNLLGSR